MKKENLARHKKRLWACLLLSSLLVGSAAQSAWAAEASKPGSEPKAAVETEEFALEEVTVTALRYKSKNLETPADVSSYSREQLKATGATNLADALKYSTGLIYSSMGPHGQSWGNMTSKIIIRGVESGTLVMMNGVPINMNGYYHLESIPVEQVERVEVLKGGGSVLYGSEALGGIINIITREKVQNSVTISGGNDGQSHSMSLQAGKSSFNVSFGKTNESGVMTDPKANATYGTTGGSYYTAFGDATKNNVNWHYKFDDHFSANYSYGKDDYSVLYKKVGDDSLLRSSDYIDESHRLQLAYDKNGWSSKAFFNRQHVDQRGTEPALANKHDWTDTTNTVYGIDTQKTWQAGGATWLAGTTVQRESYNDFGQTLSGNKAARTLKAPYTNGPHDRNHYALYMQWDKELSSKNRLIIGAREDVVKTGEGQRFDALSPQLQFLHRLDENRSLYLNTSKSFRMPNFTALYKTSSDNFISNPDLKPETGLNQEVGYKYEKGDVKWKVAAFRLEVDDQITWKKIVSGGSTYYVAQNVSKFRNSGIEASYDHKLSKHWSYSFGSSFGNPEQQESDGGAWTRTLGRMTFNGALHYMSGPWTADLSAMYYGDRVDSDGVDRSAMIPVSLHVGYKLKENRTLTFDVDNLLNRRDVTTNSSAYYMPERSFRLGLTATF